MKEKFHRISPPQEHPWMAAFEVPLSQIFEGVLYTLQQPSHKFLPNKGLLGSTNP